MGEREGDVDRWYLFCANSPVTARATLQACLCASFFNQPPRSQCKLAHLTLTRASPPVSVPSVPAMLHLLPQEAHFSLPACDGRPQQESLQALSRQPVPTSSPLDEMWTPADSRVV